ncbi:MAG: hypothetical protein ACR2HN_01865 [Tepidiformaceae bacterium]
MSTDFSSSAVRIDAGAAVRDSNGKEFARIKEVAPRYIKLDVPSARDYWLDRACICEAGDGYVQLSMTREEANAAGLASPGADDDPTATVMEDGEDVPLESRRDVEDEYLLRRGGTSVQ